MGLHELDAGLKNLTKAMQENIERNLKFMEFEQESLREIEMTDPFNALVSFQEELLHDRLTPQRCELDLELYFYVDKPQGKPRFTYVKLKDKTVTAFVSFAIVDPFEGLPCLNIGYAVPDAFRKQGRATQIVAAAIREMRHGLSRAGKSSFYVEAMIDVDNKASQRVAEKVISTNPTATTDEVSGKPALQYLRRIDPDTTIK